MNRRDDLAERQNAESAIRLQAAASTFYGYTRRIRALEVFFVVLVPSALSIGAAFFHQLDLTAALWGFGVALLDVSIFYPLANAARRNGAQVQEQFDSQVLGLPLMLSRVSDGPDIEKIDVAASKKLAQIGAEATFVNWYAEGLGRLKSPLDRIACQRSNSVWDDGLRAWFQGVLIAVIIIGTIVIFCLQAYGKQPGDKLVTAFLFPLLPAYLWAIREWQDQREARIARREMRRLGSVLWDGYLDGVLSEERVLAGSDDLQGAIFNSRATAPPVPQFLYWILRKRFESQMVHSAAVLVDDALSRRPDTVK